MSRGALRDYRRGVGRVRRFDVQLPPVRVSARTSLALRTVANTVGISVADAVREAISAYIDIPAEEPNADHLEVKS